MELALESINCARMTRAVYTLSSFPARARARERACDAVHACLSLTNARRWKTVARDEVKYIEARAKEWITSAQCRFGSCSSTIVLQIASADARRDARRRTAPLCSPERFVYEYSFAARVHTYLSRDDIDALARSDRPQL